MSMLGAFFRGAAGAGLVDYANRLDRRDAMAAEDERRKREREEERAWRSSEAEKDRVARAESAAIRSGGRRSGSGSGGGDGEGGGDDYAVAAIMKKFNVSEGKARQLLEANRQDQNPFGQAVGGDEVGPPQADMKRWGELNSAIAESLRSGASMARSNYAQLKEGDILGQRERVNQGMLDGKLTMPQTAEANAAMSGKGGFENARTSEFTGTPTAIGKSEIAENYAQAGSASRANRDKVDVTKLPPNVQRELALLEEREKAIAGKINDARSKADEWNPDENPGQKQLLTEYRSIQMRRNALMDGGSGPGDPLGLFRDQPDAKPADKPKKAGKPNESAAEDARLSRAPKPPEKPGMLDRAASWVRGQQDVEGSIRERVKEAKAGGEPLTPGEVQLAKRYGIPV